MADGKKDDSFSLADARARLANRLGRVSRQHQEWRDFGVPYDESVYSDETKSMRSIHQSDIDRRDFGAPDAPPHGVIETCDQNRDSMLDDSDGKKGVQVPSAGPAVQPVPVAVSAPLAPGAAGGDSPGVAGAGPSPRGIVVATVPDKPTRTIIELRAPPGGAHGSVLPEVAARPGLLTGPPSPAGPGDATASPLTFGLKNKHAKHEVAETNAKKWPAP